MLGPIFRDFEVVISEFRDPCDVFRNVLPTNQWRWYCTPNRLVTVSDLEKGRAYSVIPANSAGGRA